MTLMMKLVLLSHALLLCHVAGTHLSFLSSDVFSAARAMAVECECNFNGVCSCDASSEFHTCVTNACNSGKCQCGDNGADHVNSACNVMSAACPKVGLQCQAGEFTCGGGSTAAATATNGTTKAIPIHIHDAKIEERLVHGHHLFAMLFLFLFLTTVGFFAMVESSIPVLVMNTWSVIDSIVVTVIATSLFYFFSNGFAEFADGHAEWHTTLHILWAVGVLVFAMFGAWMIRGNASNLNSFNAVFYYVCLLSKGGALTEAQSKLSASLEHVALITFLSLIFFAVLMLCTHRIKPEPEWYDSVETSLAAGAFASGVTMFVHLCINGMGHDTTADIGNFEAYATFVFAAVTCALAASWTPCLTRRINAVPKEHYWSKRFLEFITSFVGIMPYFTVSFGAGPCLCAFFKIANGTLMASLITAMCNVLIGVLMIMVVAFTPYLQRAEEGAQSVASLMTGFGGYVAGYALAMLLCGTIDEILEGRQYRKGMNPHIWRLILISGINVVLIPVYVKMLAPLVALKKQASK